MKTTLFFFLMCLYVECSGAIIIINGQLSPLEYSGELYYLPQTYVISPETTNLFVTIDGINKVCFLNTVPSLLFEQISQINIVISGVKTEWNCFPYRTTVFEIRP